MFVCLFVCLLSMFVALFVCCCFVFCFFDCFVGHRFSYACGVKHSTILLHVVRRTVKEEKENEKMFFFGVSGLVPAAPAV